MKLILPIQILLGIVLVHLAWMVYSRSVDFAARRKRVEAAESVYKIGVCSHDRFVYTLLRFLLQGQINRDGLPVAVDTFDRSSRWDAVLLDSKVSEPPPPRDLEGLTVIVILRLGQSAPRAGFAEYTAYRLGTPPTTLFALLGIVQTQPPEEAIEPPRAVLLLLAALIAAFIVWLAVLLVRGM